MKNFILLLALFLLFSCSLRGRGSHAASLVAPEQDQAETTVRGELLKAFHSAYTAFVRNKQFPSHRKNIANYDVQFTETADNIVVFFYPRRKPDEPRLMGGSTSLGMLLKVVVSKADYRVIDIKGFK